MQLYASAAVVVLVAGLGLAALTGDGDVGDRVLLEPAEAAGPDPFTGPLWDAPPDVALTAEVRADAADAGVARTGDEPGLFGGVRGEGWCDPDALVARLKARPAIAWAWAGVHRIEPVDIEPLVAALTPVVLLADVQVSAHGLVDDEAVLRQSVLQAGTAVLVDQTGVPRVRCASGDPLGPPADRGRQGPFAGERWDGFNPERVQRIDAAEEPMDELELVDLTEGGRFRRLVGPHVDDRDLVEPGEPPPREGVLVVRVDGPGDVAGGRTDGIGCGTDCRQVYDVGTKVRLRATPDPEARLVGWSGACHPPTGASECTVTIEGPTTEVGVAFEGPPERRPGQPRRPSTRREARAVDRGPRRTPDGPVEVTTATDRARPATTTRPTDASPPAPPPSFGPDPTTTTTTQTPPPPPPPPPPPATQPLTVSVEGSGEVHLATGEICAGTCTYDVPTGVEVEATAVAAPGWWLRELLPCGAGPGGGCAVRVDGPAAVHAVFAPDPQLVLTVDGGGAVEVVGSATATCSAFNPATGATCNLPVPMGGGIELHAALVGEGGRVFTGWSGACAGLTGPSCTLSLTGDQEVHAHYGLGHG